MTSSDIFNYIAALSCKIKKGKKIPSWPSIPELLEYVNEYNQIEISELRAHLNALWKEGKIKPHANLNSVLIEVIN